MLLVARSASFSERSRSVSPGTVRPDRSLTLIGKRRSSVVTRRTSSPGTASWARTVVFAVTLLKTRSAIEQRLSQARLALVRRRGYPLRAIGGTSMPSNSGLKENAPKKQQAEDNQDRYDDDLDETHCRFLGKNSLDFGPILIRGPENCQRTV